MKKSMCEVGVMRAVVAGVVLMVVAGVAYGRGEPWVPKPPVPPPVEMLTNADLYLEWKWRTDVTDPSTGVNAATASARVRELAAKLEPKEPWCVGRDVCRHDLRRLRAGVSDAHRRRDDRGDGNRSRIRAAS